MFIGRIHDAHTLFDKQHVVLPVQANPTQNPNFSGLMIEGRWLNIGHDFYCSILFYLSMSMTRPTTEISGFLFTR